MQIRAEIDQRAIDDIKRMLKPGQAKVALQAAVSRTITTGVAMVSRRIGEEVKLPIARIKRSVTSKRGSFDKPEGSISVDKGKGVWLSEFLTGAIKRLAKKGVRSFGRQRVQVSVRKRATAKYPVKETLPNAFVLPSPPLSLKLGIFERIGIKRAMKSGRYKGKVREVIARKRGPAPLSVFVNAKGNEGAATIFAEVFKKLTEVFQKNIHSQLDRFLRPRGDARTQQLTDRAEQIS